MAAVPGTTPYTLATKSTVKVKVRKLVIAPLT